MQMDAVDYEDHLGPVPGRWRQVPLYEQYHGEPSAREGREFLFEHWLFACSPDLGTLIGKTGSNGGKNGNLVL